jgi:hypothetical protein
MVRYSVTPGTSTPSGFYATICDMSNEKFLQAARHHAATFVANAKEQHGITLNYKVLDLIMVPEIIGKYHAIYKQAAAAKDTNLNDFVKQASFEATSYLGEVCVRSGAAWEIGEKRDIYLRIGKERFPIHQQVLEDIVKGSDNVLQMIPKITKELADSQTLLRNPATAQAFSEKPSKPAPPQPPVDAALQEKMRQYAERAVQVAIENMKLKLDYQWQTLATMDEVVDSFHRFVLAKGDKQEFIHNATTTYGAYVGEVVRRTHGGHWMQDSPHQPPWLWVSGGRFDILTRVHQRITSGTPPTLRAYWDEVAQESRSATSAKPQYDYTALTEEMKKSAAVAVQDVKAMLKRELDFTRASLPVLHDALVRVREMIAMAPEHKTAVVNASMKKYGAYLGEVIKADCGAVWRMNVEGLPDDQPALNLGNMYAVPQHMIQAVLEGKSLFMGGMAEPATTVTEYFACCRRLQDEWLTSILSGKQTQESTLAEMSDDVNIAARIYNHCAQALVTAYSKWAVRFDLSPASIEGLEDLLTKLWDVRRSPGSEAPPTQEQIAHAVVMWGSYLGEVIRRTLGGKWVAGSGPPARPVLQVTSQNVIDPWGKVNGRLFNGTEDNVHYYFKKLVEHFQQPVAEQSPPAASGDERPKAASADVVAAAQVSAPPSPPSPPPEPEEIEIGGEEIVQLQQQVSGGDLTGLRQTIARMLENREWQDRLFVIDRVIPKCQLHVLDQACEAEPQAADVVLLRCALFSHLAREARGSGTVEQTSEAQFGTAGSWVKEALREYERAGQLNPAEPTLHAIVMRPLVIFGDMRERLRDAYFKATRLAPSFVSPHFTMVTAESERWGGSHDKSLHIARGAMLGAPGDSAVCLFWAHILVWTHILGFDRDQAKAQSYRKSPGIVKELAQAFDAWIGGSYQPRRSSVLYFHYAAFWFYLAGDRERLRQALSYTQGLFCELPWAMIGNAREVHAKAVKAAAAD